ncbi:MAG: hypothetical protein AB7F53_02585 [Nitrososphaeraceae archaeon]
MESNYKKLVFVISVIAIIVVFIQLNGVFGFVTENIANNETRNNNNDIQDSDDMLQKISNNIIIETIRQIELSFY